jgi:uncharacterized protein (TIGR03435 family)
MIVEAVFWFHPLVWWIGAKLVEERERACDEGVLQQGKAPHVYAEGILNVCKFYVESPLPCASGVSGSDLKRRIKEIMTQRVSCRLTLTRKLILSAAGFAVLSAPVIIGFLRAQTLPPPPEHTYDVVSIRPSKTDGPSVRIGPGPQGGMRTENTAVMQLLTFAYDLREYQFESIPGWVKSERYDVQFTPDKPEVRLGPGMARDQMEGVFKRQRQRMQAILRDRFGLVLRAELRELPIYAMTIAKGGHKLKPSEQSANPGPNLRMSPSQLSARGAYMNMLTHSLSSLLGRTVTNETGLDGPFDVELHWARDSSIQLPGPGPGPGGPGPGGPGPGGPGGPGLSVGTGPGGAPPDAASDTGGPNIFTALTEQLGLKLESKKGPVQVYVIEKIEKPSEN